MDIKTELLHVFGPQIQPFCGPLFFTSSLASAEGTITHNAGFGLVDTGEKKLLVTCAHVLTEFEQLRRENPGLKMGVCLEEGRPVELDPRQNIDSDPNLDIATFDVAPLLGFCRGRQFYEIDRSPSLALKKGDSLAFHCYPGGRRLGKTTGVEFGRITFAVTVTDITDFKVVADVSKVKRCEPHRQPSLSDPYGGSSGSPAFLRRENKFPQLVAFTTSVLEMGNGLKVLCFTRAQCIGRDGIIRGK